MSGQGKVLVVEDDSILAMRVEDLLRELGYVPVVCVSGEDAVETARLIEPALVLMDVRLRGDMTGLEAAEIIRDELACPIAFMTAYGDRDTAARMRRIAGDNVMGKPLSEPILRMTIRQLIRD
jgi:DNA-binding response OmpR family regulator